MIPQPIPTTHTPEERQGITEAFRRAKSLLWDGTPTIHGKPPNLYRDGIDEFICHALAHSDHPERHAAKDVIQQRIKPWISYESWLLDYYKHEQLTKQFLQTLRHQWLDSLIKEFSE